MTNHLVLNDQPLPEIKWLKGTTNQYERVTVRPFSCNWRSVEDIQHRQHTILGPRATFPRQRGPLHSSLHPAHLPPRARLRLRGAAGLRDLISGRPAPGTPEQLTPDPQQPPAPGHLGQRFVFGIRLLGDYMLPFARKIDL